MATRDVNFSFECVVCTQINLNFKLLVYIENVWYHQVRTLGRAVPVVSGCVHECCVSEQTLKLHRRQVTSAALRKTRKPS